MSAHEQFERMGFGMDVKAMSWERINGLMCTESKGDPLMCFDCPKVKSCQVGQRAVVLLDEMTREKKRGVYNKAKNFAKEALSHSDPVKFLMDTGLARESARSRIRSWRKIYPDLFEGIVVQFNNHSAPPKPPCKRHTDEELFEEYKAAKASDDPTGYIEKERGLKRASANALWGKLRRRFEGVSEVPKDEPNIEQIDGQISLKDFIDSFEPDDASNDQEMGQEVVSDDSVKEIINSKTEGIEDPLEGQIKFTYGENVYGELNSLFYKVDTEKEQVKKEIMKLEARLEWLNDMGESLSRVASLLNMGTAK